MTHEVVWAPAAQSDLVRILQYVLEHNPPAADRVATRIEDAVAALGSGATGRPGRIAKTFEKVVRGLPYIIAYEVDVQPGSGQRVSILRIIHGARDWPVGRWPDG